MMKPIAAKNMPDAGLTAPLTRDLPSQPAQPTVLSHASSAAISQTMLITGSSRQSLSSMPTGGCVACERANRLAATNHPG
jgi:hypothetical protein